MLGAIYDIFSILHSAAKEERYDVVKNMLHMAATLGKDYVVHHNLVYVPRPNSAEMAYK